MKLLALAGLFCLPLSLHATVIDLGTAASFAVLAGSTITNIGSSMLTGNLGVSPGTAITGFGPGSFTGTEYDGDAVAAQAESDLTTAYNVAVGEPCGQNLTGEDLGGLILLPGVYCFDSSAQLTGTVTLNTEGEQNPQFVFQIGSTLTTASDSSVVFENDGGQGDDNVFWQVGSSATVGTSTSFAGDLMAVASITLTTGASIQCGSALAQNGAVTLDDNDISACQAESSSGSAPEPSAGFLMLAIGALSWLGRRTFVRGGSQVA
jgi:type VI secretion system secreted protein VgrG